MIGVKISSGNYIPHNTVFRVRHDRGQVILFAGSRAEAMRTPESFRVGFALAKLGGKATGNEFVTLSIHGAEFQIPPAYAVQIGGAILRKTDDADDYQRAMRSKTA